MRQRFCQRASAGVAGADEEHQGFGVGQDLGGGEDALADGYQRVTVETDHGRRVAQRAEAVVDQGVQGFAVALQDLRRVGERGPFGSTQGDHVHGTTDHPDHVPRELVGRQPQSDLPLGIITPWHDHRQGAGPESSKETSQTGILQASELVRLNFVGQVQRHVELPVSTGNLAGALQLLAVIRQDGQAVDGLSGQYDHPACADRTSHVLCESGPLLRILGQAVGAAEHVETLGNAQAADCAKQVKLIPCVQLSMVPAPMTSNNREERLARIRLQRLAELGGLLAGFAHEVRNPLSTIGLNLQLVLEEFEEAETARDKRTHKRLSTVEAEVRRLQKILEEFLSFARQPEPRLEPIDLNARLQAMIDLHAPALAEQGVSIRFYPAREVGEVPADWNHLQAALVNLLRNAADATPAGGQVMIATTREGEDVVVRVTDSGAGIEPELQGRVFDPYFSTKETGTGLGLPTVKRVVEEHGGTLTLASDVGKGTQFTLRLPSRANSSGGTSADAENDSP